jgi:hypothetical protein
MEQIWQALGLTALFTLGSVTIVGGIMWLLYIYFNRYLPGSKKTQQEGDAKNLNN